MHKIYFILFLITFLLSKTNTNLTELILETEPHSIYKEGKIYTSDFIHIAPHIDGILDEQCWEGLDGFDSSIVIIDDFLQQQPFYLAKPTYNTHVKIIHDQEYIYIGVILYDSEPQKIKKQLSRRDEWGSSCDWFSIEFDSNHDHQTSYRFDINASGIQADAMSYLDSDDNWAYNANWESSVKIHELGWNVEIKIPYKMLNITQIENPWGMNITRYIYRYNEYSAWVTMPMEIPGIASHFGHILGLKETSVSKAAELKPYFLYGYNYIENTLLIDEESLPTSFMKDMIPSKTDNFGLDLRYRLSPSNTLDFTLNPDFGQIEMDPKYINLSYYEIYFPEKRIFFSDSESFFNTPIEIFYSRRIGSDVDTISNKINSALKIDGTSNTNLSYSLLVSNTSPQNYKYKIIDNRYSNSYYISRISKDLFYKNISSTIGISGTYFQNKSKKASVFSLDNLTYLLSNQLIVDCQIVRSINNNIHGNGFYFSTDYHPDAPFYLDLNMVSFDENFNINEIGYIRRNNYKDYEINIGFKKYINQDYDLTDINFFKINISHFQSYNFDKLTLRNNLGIEANIYFKNYSHIIIGHKKEDKHYDDYYMYDNNNKSNGPAFLLPRSDRSFIKFNSNENNSLFINIEMESSQDSNNDSFTNSIINLKTKIGDSYSIGFDYQKIEFQQSYNFLEMIQDDEDNLHYIFSSIYALENRYGIRMEKYFNNKMSFQIYSEYFKRKRSFSDYKEWKEDEQWPISGGDFIDGWSETVTDECPDNPSENCDWIVDYYPLYSEGIAMPEDGQYLDPNYYVGFYPRYTNLNINLSFKWEYAPESSMYIVYRLSNSVNGKLFNSLKEFINYNNKNSWTEKYYNSAIYLKVNYWFDI